MSQLIEKILNDVCLDDRIPDGIFQMENENHMDVLRGYFVKRGLTKESSIDITNRMVEGKYPERQAYRKEDGILVTWPSIKHMANAFKENPGKYTKDNPNPDKDAGESPKEPIKREPPVVDDDDDDDDELTDEEPSSRSGGNIFGRSNGKNIRQGEKELEVEPPRGEEKPEPIPVPTFPTPELASRTPERIGAEKEVVKQIFNSSNSNLSSIDFSLTELCRYQLNELCKKADEWGMREAEKFLDKCTKY